MQKTVEVTAEKVILKVRAENEVEAQLTYSSFLSMDKLSGVSNEDTRLTIASIQSKSSNVTIENIKDYGGATLRDILETFIEYLIANTKYSTITAFVDEEEVTAYEKFYGFEKVVYIEELKSWVMVRRIRFNDLEETSY